jgi:hypothetical protein
MNCKTCDYPLWNIRARECPECGTPFKPSDFEFTLNAVRFCCPHCGQDYYGTGDKGHLVPAAFRCVSCARPISMDECVLLPTAGIAEEQTRPDDMPWFERRRLGLLIAWFKTIGRSMISPGRLMDAIPPSAPSGIVYAVVTTSLYFLFSIAPIFVFALVMGVGIGGRANVNALAGMAGGGSIGLLVIVVTTILYMLLWIGCAHATLKLTGGTAYPIRRTSQALCYSSGANALSAIPCLGAYFSFLFIIWWLVSAGIMLTRAQRVSGLRAAFAVVALPLVTIIAGAVWFAVAITAAIGAANSITPPPPAVAGQPVSDATATQIALVLRGDAMVRNGVASDDVAALVKSGMLPPTTFASLTPDTDTSEREVTPEGRLVGHRVDDLVFVHQGIHFPSADPALWLFVILPTADDPRFRPVRVDGTIDAYATPDAMRDAMDEQDALRAKAGLTPLPLLLRNAVPDE